MKNYTLKEMETVLNKLVEAEAITPGSNDYDNVLVKLQRREIFILYDLLSDTKGGTSE